MRRHAKAPSAGSTEGNGSSRGLIRRAFAIRGASSGSDGSGARHRGQGAKLFVVLVLAVSALACAAAPASALTVTINPATNVSYASADVSGEVPGWPTNAFLGYAFEYSTDHTNWTVGNDNTIGGFAQVSASLKGLKGGTKYFLRLFASDYVCGGCDTGTSPEIEFETLPVIAPTVLATDDATAVFSTTAQVSGEVERPANPNSAFDADCRFEYATDAQFTATGFDDAGQKPCDTNPITAPGAHSVTADLSGLSPSTTYHLRLAASNAGGTDRKEASSTFTTLAAVEQPPTVLGVDAVSETTYVTAKVSGSVERPVGADPALDGICRFEYVTDASFQPRNEVQSLAVRATGGTFTLSFGAQTTAPLAFDAGAAGVQAALEGLSTVGPGAVAVSGGPGDEAGSSPYAIAFTGALADKDVEAIIPDPSSLTSEAGAGAEVQTSVEGRPEGFNDPAQVNCKPSRVTAPGASPVTAELHGLTFSTTYHLRLTVSNYAGSDSQEAPSTFRTSSAPKAQTLAAGGIQADSAALAARINPLDAPVSYRFEWGATSNYGNFAPAGLEPLAAADASFHGVTAPLAGLNPATPYHFRIVAINTLTGEESKGEDRSFTTLPTPGGDAPCPNEVSRVGFSAALPDCRAYEWVTPDINNIFSEENGDASALPDGSAIRYRTYDAPDNAAGSLPLGVVVSRRGSNGWESHSLSPSSPEPYEAFYGGQVDGLVSSDFREWLVESSLPLSGDRPRSDMNLYLHRADGTYAPISLVGQHLQPPNELQWILFGGNAQASGDFKHIFFRRIQKQLEADPVGQLNAYEWVDGEVRLVGWLPSVGGAPEQLAPNGASFAGTSYDGHQVLFKAGGYPGLYLRTDGLESKEISASQRFTDPDPNPPAAVNDARITKDGSEVLFTSASELTEDAYTGETDGVANDKGADLYSYDVSSEELTDLTVNHNPEDAATGAGVSAVLGATEDASYIYFVATGKLAPGATSGEPNLYVEHNGEIKFVSPGNSLFFDVGRPHGFYVTPDGRHAAFLSLDSLTGYDNVNPNSGQPELEAFKYSYDGGGLECASCRPSGEPPESSTVLHGRALSDDGSRLFFESADAVVPAASGGLPNVFEYVGGRVSLLTPGDADQPAYLFDASASGEDVFIGTHQELTPGSGTMFAVYDARINADTLKPTAPECQGEGCRGAGSSAPGASSTGSAKFEAPGEVTVPKAKAAKAKKLKLRVTVPESGQVTLSGKGIKTVKKDVAKAGPVTLTVSLKPGANKTRLSKGVFKTKAQVLFKPKSGSVSRSAEARPVVALTFEGPTGKGGK